MGCENGKYEAKIKELENLMNRYQKLSKWIEKVVEFDFNNPSPNIYELNLDN